MYGYSKHSQFLEILTLVDVPNFGSTKTDYFTKNSSFFYFIDFDCPARLSGAKSASKSIC